MEANNELNKNEIKTQESDEKVKEINIINKEELEAPKYTLSQLEEFLKNKIVPPGIEEYDDLPPEEPLTATSSKIKKQKKPWENDNNIDNSQKFEISEDDNSNIKEIVNSFSYSDSV